MQFDPKCNTIREVTELTQAQEMTVFLGRSLFQPRMDNPATSPSVSALAPPHQPDEGTAMRIGDEPAQQHVLQHRGDCGHTRQRQGVHRLGSRRVQLNRVADDCSSTGMSRRSSITGSVVMPDRGSPTLTPDRPSGATR
jgi:hypothetical protein